MYSVSKVEVSVD